MRNAPIVYLAGGIAGLSYGQATDWRGIARLSLANRNVETLDPMRAKEAARDIKDLTYSKDVADRGIFFTTRGIMARDFCDVRRCDALLVNLIGASKQSAGTIMELAWAFALQKPAVVAIEATGNPHDLHPMIHEAMPFRVTTLDEAIDAVAVILGR